MSLARMKPEMPIDLSYSGMNSDVIEDLRKHTPQQLAELRLLLSAGLLDRPDSRRPGFFEIDGAANVYYVLRFPFGHKILFVAAWDRQREPVAGLVTYTYPAA
jgi:hypothetical protein